MNQRTAHVMYQTNIDPSVLSRETMEYVSKRITENLADMGNIVVPIENIENVMNTLYDNYRFYANPMSMYHVTSDEPIDLTRQTINLICRQIRDEFALRHNASKLSIWTTILGDYNEHGLRSHPTLKIRKRKPDTMMFNMPI